MNDDRIKPFAIKNMDTIDSSDHQDDHITKIKEEFPSQEVFYFTSPNTMNYNSETQKFEITDSAGNNIEVPESAFSIPFNDDQLNQLMRESNVDNTEGGRRQIDLSKLLNMPCLKDDMGNSSPHFVKFRPDGNGKNVKIWECGICHKEFGHQYILMRHLPTHTDERKYKCNQCGKAFRQMSTLSQHRAIHSKQRPYVCDVCQKTFNRVSTLISHRKTHTGLKPHKCNLCNKAFHQKGNLRNHIFTHTNARPYKCDVCEKGFNQMSNLMCHKFKAHHRSDKPKYHCSKCDKEFEKRIGLRNHEQYEHRQSNNHSPPSNAIASLTTSSETSSSSVFSENFLQRTPTNDISTPAVQYTNGVLVPRINTAAMRHIKAMNKVPFALLRPMDGIPVIVRVLPAADRQMVVPATADELRKHSEFDEADKENVNPDEKDEIKKVSIPIVATIVQRRHSNGMISMDIENPGPAGDTMNGEDYYRQQNNSDASSDDDDDTSEFFDSEFNNDFMVDYDDEDSYLRDDPRMYDFNEASTSPSNYEPMLQPIDIDCDSVQMFNTDNELDIDIARSVMDLESGSTSYDLMERNMHEMSKQDSIEPELIRLDVDEDSNDNTINEIDV